MHKRFNSGRTKLLGLVCGAALIAGVSGCEAMEEFRAAAGDSLKTGVNALADGLIDGIFAVFEPDDTTDQ